MWIFPVIKIVIGALFSPVGFAVLLSGLFPNFAKQIQNKGESVIRHRNWLKRGILITVGFLFTAYFISEVVTGIKGLGEQSLQYQNQMILKYHVQNFATDLSGFSKSFDPQTSGDFSELQTVFSPQLNSYKQQLYAEGIRSTNLENLFDKSTKLVTTADYKTNMNAIASELNKMASQLPTPQ
jgi:hypothetical protein